MKKTTLLSLFMMGFLIFAFQYEDVTKHHPDKITIIEETPQRTGGDAAQGWDFLRYGNYIGAGVPYNIFKLSIKKDNVKNYLDREGKSEIIPYSFSAFTENGVEVVGGLNCFGCHASFINGEFVAGLGNSNSDFVGSDGGKFFKRMHTYVKVRHGKKSGQYKAFLPLYRGSEYVAPYIDAPFVGVNPAFKLEEAAVSFRHPEDLSWADNKQLFKVSKKVYASDVPPLWNVKKKNALYYNAMGRGDFTKLLMQVMVVAIEDSTEARGINDQFHHVLAWLESLEPPKFPNPIDSSVLATGKALFEDNCSKCHGYYGEADEYYPNKLVGTNIVQTDSIYARYSYDNEEFTNWLNESWIMTSAPKAWVQPEMGYIAPPLDGVWATAPYLHNGSVPDLETLLDSKKRPTYWQRPISSQDNYDLEKVGLRYTVKEKADNNYVYNTTMKGYGNYGHTFGDKLEEAERRAVLEYLKTL